MFSECGCVVRVFFAPAEKFDNPESSKYTHGFIGYADEYGVKKAVNWFHGKMLHGRRIRVEETLKTAACIGKQPTGTSSGARSKGTEVNEKWTYIQKSYDDVAPAKPERKLPAWSDLEKRIQSQTYSLSPPFTFPVQNVSLDLYAIPFRYQLDSVKICNTPVQAASETAGGGLSSQWAAYDLGLWTYNIGFANLFSQRTSIPKAGGHKFKHCVQLYTPPFTRLHRMQSAQYIPVVY